MSNLTYKNNAETTLTEDIAIGETAWDVDDASKLSSLPDFLVTCWDQTTYRNPEDDPNMEIARVTGIAGNTLTVIKNQEGTGDNAHDSGDTVAMLVTAGTLQGIQTAVRDGLTFYCNYDKQVNANYSIGSGTATLTTANISAIWHFGDGTGITPVDSSGNGFTLDAINTPAWTPSGYHGSALDYDSGSSEYCEKSSENKLNPDSSDFTVGIRFKIEDTASGGVRYLLSKYLAVNDTYWFKQHTDDKLHWLIFQGIGVPNAQSVAITDNALSFGQWYFAVGTWDFSAEDTVLYVDSDSFAGVTTGAVGAVTNTEDLEIGSLTGGGSNFNGVIDEVFILKGTALDADEVATLFNNRWYDRTYLDGKFGQGYYSFKGNALSYPTANNINKDVGTIEMWVYPSWDGDDGIQHIFFDMETANGTNQIQFSKGNTNVLFIRIGDSAVGVRQNLYAVNGTNFAKNTWHHIAATWDMGSPPTSVDLELYLDGELVDSSEQGGGTGLITVLPTTMHIGKDAGSQQQEATSIIDEFKIYDRALTAGEIKRNYEATQPLLI